MPQMLTVYHYTNREGRDAIRRSGKILKSDGLEQDAAYGAGVYFTTLSPEGDMETVAKNNWVAYKKSMKKGKLDYAIRIDIPKEELRKVGEKSRKIYVYRGNVILREYEHDFIECRWEEETYEDEELDEYEETEEDEEQAASRPVSRDLKEICVTFKQVVVRYHNA